MREYDGQGVLVLRSDVNEMNAETVNLRTELRQPIQRALDTTPIVVSAPVFNERLCFGERYPLGPIRYRFLVRPASIGKSPFEIVQCGLRHMDLEGCKALRRRREHNVCGLVGARVGTRWQRPCGQHSGTTGCGGCPYELAARSEECRRSRVVF